MSELRTSDTLDSREVKIMNFKLCDHGVDSELCALCANEAVIREKQKREREYWQEQEERARQQRNQVPPMLSRDRRPDVAMKALRGALQ